MVYVLAGTSLTRMILIGGVFQDPLALPWQVLPLDTVVMVSSTSNILFV